MKMNAKYLLGKRQFKMLTGLTPHQFRASVKRLAPAWDKREALKRKAGRPCGVGGVEDHLLVLLILYRCHITQDFLALLFGVDKSCICRTLQRIEPLAKRIIGVKKQIRVSAEEAEALIIDCTEQPVQRPKRKQRTWYSGKKKRHTVKAEVVVTERGRIVSVSGSGPGRRHDLSLRRKGPVLPKGARIYTDNAYQGLEKDHPELETPYKRSKNTPLTPDEKDYNRALSRYRVRGEHAIARLKRFRIMSDRYRYPRPTHGLKLSVAAGLANIAAGF